MIIKSFRFIGLIQVSIFLSIILLAFFHPAQVKAESVVCDEEGNQYYPKIITDGSEGSIIVWRDDRSFHSAIYAQRMNAEGEAQWGENGIPVTGNTNHQDSPQILSDGSGGAFITWEGGGGDGYEDIFAQHINSAGSLQWGADGVHVCDRPRGQRDIRITSDGSGGIIITWEDNRNDSYLQIYAQRISSAGISQWTENGVLVCGIDYGQQDPTITSDGSCGAIIAWSDNRKTPAGSKGFYVQRLNSSGIAQWTANGVALYLNDDYGGESEIISDGSGGAIITWYDERNGNYDIYAQRINSSGESLWTAGGVAVCNEANPQYAPRIAGDGGGGAFIIWNDTRASGVNIYAQRLSSEGVSQWTANGVAVTNVSGEKPHPRPRFIRYGSEDIIITWDDYRSGNADVYAQRVNGSGEAQWTINGVQVSGGLSEQDYPDLIGDGSGGAYIVWEDLRSNSEYDIYLKRVYSNGLLTLPEISFTSVTQQVDENGVSTDITLQLSAVSDIDVTVPFTISGIATEGAVADFTITESPVVFSAGTDSGTITIYINDDSEIEPNETITITLGTPTNAILGTTTIHTITIMDNEPSADIAVNKSASSRKVKLNEQVVFTVEVKNNGPDNATGIVVSDILPAGLTYVSHQAAKGSYDQETGQWTLGALDNGESSTLTLTITAVQKGRITNSAVKTASTPADPNTGNDTDSSVLFVGMSNLSWLMLLLED
ncbi:MAG: DUF11 domain-containing protein [Deltaproteobacteria bacterium]|nr:DUF11 domain-containing protein [Deltaproteobacteria bacterium]